MQIINICRFESKFSVYEYVSGVSGVQVSEMTIFFPKKR